MSSNTKQTRAIGDVPAKPDIMIQNSTGRKKIVCLSIIFLFSVSAVFFIPGSSESTAITPVNATEVGGAQEAPAREKDRGDSERMDLYKRDNYIYRAREHEKKQDHAEALTAYKKALNIDKDNISIIIEIAYIYLRLDLLQESVKYSEMALDIDRDYLPALVNIGIVHARLNNTAAAKNYLKRAVEFDPDNQSAVLNLAILYERQKNTSKATGYYMKLMKFRNVQGTLGMARIYERQDKTDAALKLYKSIYDRETIDDSTKVRIRKRMTVLLDKKRREEAIKLPQSLSK